MLDQLDLPPLSRGGSLASQLRRLQSFICSKLQSEPCAQEMACHAVFASNVRGVNLQKTNAL